MDSTKVQFRANGKGSQRQERRLCKTASVQHHQQAQVLHGPEGSGEVTRGAHQLPV